MAIIGSNDIGSGDTTGAINSSIGHFWLNGSGYFYTAGANEEVFRFGFYCGYAAGDGSGLKMALYKITGTNEGTLVAGTEVTLTGLSTSSLNTSEITPVALENGSSYGVACCTASTTNVVISGYDNLGAGVSGATRQGGTNGSTFDSSWNDSSDYNKLLFMYAETQASTSGVAYDYRLIIS